MFTGTSRRETGR